MESRAVAIYIDGIQICFEYIPSKKGIKETTAAISQICRLGLREIVFRKAVYDQNLQEKVTVKLEIDYSGVRVTHQAVIQIGALDFVTQNVEKYIQKLKNEIEKELLYAAIRDPGIIPLLAR